MTIDMKDRTFYECYLLIFVFVKKYVSLCDSFIWNVKNGQFEISNCGKFSFKFLSGIGIGIECILI